MGIILINILNFSKSFRITVLGLDIKELVESLTRCLGKLGRFPRKMGRSQVTREHAQTI